MSRSRTPLPHVMSSSSRPDLPGLEAARALSEWLAGPRGRLLRRSQIGLRQRVLDVGCGHGLVTEELVRRAGGMVVGLDLDPEPARQSGVAGASLTGADAARLPFADQVFDLVLCQNVLLWVQQVEQAVGEMARVLAPGGVLVAIEPDYGGMMEYPPGISVQEVWLRSLEAEGADPRVGRRLPGLFEAAGLHTWVELQHLPRTPDAAACGLLLDMPLPDADRVTVEAAREALAASPGTWQSFVHVAYVLVMGTLAD